KFVAGLVLTVAVLGATGLAYRAGAQAPAERPRAEKPLSELEALRKENELLKLNLQVVLEKVRAQEAELRELRGPRGTAKEGEQAAGQLRRAQDAVAAPFGRAADDRAKALGKYKDDVLRQYEETKKGAPAAEAVKLVEDALKLLHTARDAEGQRRAAEALE